MASLGPKKDGGPNIDFFQSPESMQGFEIVRQWLQKNCKKVSLGLGGHSGSVSPIQQMNSLHLPPY